MYAAVFEARLASMAAKALIVKCDSASRLTEVAENDEATFEEAVEEPEGRQEERPTEAPAGVAEEEAAARDD